MANPEIKLVGLAVRPSLGAAEAPVAAVRPIVPGAEGRPVEQVGGLRPTRVVEAPVLGAQPVAPATQERTPTPGKGI